MKERILKAAIFDLDGTLLDSMGLWQEVDRTFFERRGIVMPLDYGSTIAPMGFPAAAAYTKRIFSLSETEDEIISEWNALALDAYAHRVEEKPFVLEYLHRLEEKKIPIAAATASHREYWEPALRRCGLYPMFQSFTEIREVSRGKGFPDIYLEASRKLGLPAQQCAVFEDITAGVRGALKGGFYTVGVYDDHHSNEEELRTISHRFIRSFEELLTEDIFD